MIVCATQLERSSGPSIVILKSFCALIWSSQLIGGVSSLAPIAAFLNASVTSGLRVLAGAGGHPAVVEAEPARRLLVARQHLEHHVALPQPRPELGMARPCS